MQLSDLGIIAENRDGEQSTVCPRCSHDRKKSEARCLRVNAAKGVWLCHHCGWKGVLRDPENQADRNRMFEWFKSRAISSSTVIAAGVTVENGWIKFPYTKRWREVNAKYRKLGAKQFKQTTGGERSLYGLDEVPAGLERLVWVEGEMDALALREVGIVAVSVPDGAPNPGSAEGAKLQFLDGPEFERFIEAVPTHVIAVDEDAPGRTLRDALVSRLGFERCEIVSWLDVDGADKSAKDANEFLVKYGADELRKRVAGSKPIPVSGVFSIRDLSEDMYRDFQHGIESGLDTGIPGLENLWTVRPREITVVHGYPGNGKSAFMTRVAVNMAALHGWKWAMFPAENLPLHRYANKIVEYHIRKPLRDYAGNAVPQEEYFRGMKFASEHFSFIMPEEDATVDSILSRAKVLIRRWGANAIVIDPWTEVYAILGRQDKMTDVIERALRKIRKFSQTNGVHFFIVAHPSKPKDGMTGNRPPQPHEISSSMQWYNKPDCILAVHRPDREGNETDVHVQKIRFDEIGKHGTARLRFQRWGGVYEARDGEGTSRRYTRRSRGVEAGSEGMRDT